MKNKNNTSRIFKFNKWVHLWLGLISGIIVVLVCLTGSLYVFNQEISDLLHREKRIDSNNGSLLKPSLLTARALNKFTGFEPVFAYYQKGHGVNLVLKDINPSRKHPGRITVVINPYSGQMMSTILKEERDALFFRFILRGHRFLWMPVNIGRPLVNYGTLTFVILIITGLIWWYPKKWTRSTREKSFSIKWKASFKRVNLDLHNVLGFYSTIILIILSLTGMVYGLQWFSNGSYWLSTGGKSLVEYDEDMRSDTSNIPKGNFIMNAMDASWNYVTSRHEQIEGFYYFFPEKSKSTSSISITVYPTKGKKYNSYLYTFDRYSARLIKGKDIYSTMYEDAGLGLKIRKMNYDLHVGSILGFPGKIIVFLVSLIGASLPITGFLIWYGRKLKKKKSNRKAGLT